MGEAAGGEVESMTGEGEVSETAMGINLEVRRDSRVRRAERLFRGSKSHSRWFCSVRHQKQPEQTASIGTPDADSEYRHTWRAWSLPPGPEERGFVWPFDPTKRGLFVEGGALFNDAVEIRGFLQGERSFLDISGSVRIIRLGERFGNLFVDGGILSSSVVTDSLFVFQADNQLHQVSIGDEEQSAVLEAFKQLPIKTVKTTTANRNAIATEQQHSPMASRDHQQRQGQLLLAAEDVERLFPQAVKTMSRPAHDKGQEKESNKGHKGKKGGEQTAQASKTGYVDEEVEK
ncbi:unnamed protein product [Vitrella brassicaformis CCMP3155]|uniref:Uncharacterized protein n=1 Tax=Vitrella brassicaformis (strain CCMP3155) TaxID=1169540 RepID=A0A0G4G0D5_VITBC|nr:unnamed protein product [Vitrella brassicaformis CCMP3155]|eukprot:CEM21322.1 unnamed protein product [Vitrella brassicaformis CCMP3155]